MTIKNERLSSETIRLTNFEVNLRLVEFLDSNLKSNLRSNDYHSYLSSLQLWYLKNNFINHFYNNGA